MAREGADLGGNALLQTTIARETNDVLIENFVLVRIETCRRHFRRDRHTDRIAHALAERARGAFDARRLKKFRMARGFAVQLTKSFDLIHREVVTAQMQPRVEKHAAVTGRQNKIIATDPAGLVRIMFQSITVKDGAHLRASERKTEVPRLRSLHGVHAKSARFVRRARKNFEIKTHEEGYNWRVPGNQAESGAALRNA